MIANQPKTRSATATTSSKLSTYDLVIGVLAILSLVILILLIFAPLSSSTRQLLNGLEDALCAVFLFDFFRSLHRAPHKWGYVIKGGGWLDLLGSIPFSGFAVFRLARLFRIARVLRTLRGNDFRNMLMDRLAESTLLFTLVIALVLIFVISAIVASAEHSAPNANIKTYPEAVWWSFVTITTVGYGDYYPVTTTGRIAAVSLMFCGLGIIGVLSSYLATTFIALQARRQSRHRDETANNDIPAGEDNVKAEDTASGVDAELTAIRAELAALRHLLEERNQTH